MKIEKINDNQIRCILTKEDFISRQLRLSELAYGSEKAKTLFRDMMQQASFEFGFETDDLPLMIEAIPMSAESVILLISKVEYPEELDTRFSRFSEGLEEDDHVRDYSCNSGHTLPPEGADGILDLFRKIREDHEKTRPANTLTDAQFVPLSETVPVIEDVDPSDVKAVPNEAPALKFDVTKLFVFREMDDLLRLSRILYGFYNETNLLYKNPENNRYYLVISKGSHSPEDYNKVCNILTEYAIQEKYTSAEEAYFHEHFELLLPERAIQTLGAIR